MKNSSSSKKKQIFSTSAYRSWLIYSLLLILDIFTACLEIALKTTKVTQKSRLKQQNPTEYMDAVKHQVAHLFKMS